MPWSWTRRCSAATTCSAPCGSSWLSRLVQHQDARPGRHRRRDRDALALAARQLAHAPVTQRLDVEQVEHLLDAPAHVRGVDAQVLHAVGELVLDAVERRTRPRDPAARTPRRRPAAAAGARACRGPSTMTRPENVPPVKCGTSPFAARRNVDFPAPVGPATSANVPSWMDRRTSAMRGAAVSG